ncbi:MAG: GIY-YIG nuclease family protein [Bacillota bacterium]|jgi:hypothetical protein
MDRKKELKQLYKESKPEAGIYQIKNTKNGKLFIGSTLNLKTLNGKQFELETGSSTNKTLQNEWSTFGKEAFSIDVLEVLKRKEEGHFDVKHALKKLEEKWLNELKPYGEKGYNKEKLQ